MKNKRNKWQAVEPVLRDVEREMLQDLSIISNLYIQSLERTFPNVTNNQEAAVLEARINTLTCLNHIIQHLMDNEEARDRDPRTDPEALPIPYRFLTEDRLKLIAKDGK